jgi:hypothetical protein
LTILIGCASGTPCSIHSILLSVHHVI